MNISVKNKKELHASLTLYLGDQAADDLTAMIAKDLYKGLQSLVPYRGDFLVFTGPRKEDKARERRRYWANKRKD